MTALTRQVLLSVLFAIAGSVAATTALGQSLKIIGASFIEAPPGRDKNLSPFLSGNTQERAEVHAVLSVTSGMLVDVAGMARDQQLVATGVLTNKSTVALGAVETSSFAKISADRKSMLVSLAISRFPDKPIIAVNFGGSLKIRTAKSVSNKKANFTPKAGTTLDLGLGSTTVLKVEGNTITLVGGYAMERLSALKFLTADGRSVPGESRGYSRMNDRYELTYAFASTLTEGQLEASLFEGLESKDVPINLTVVRPY